MKLLTIVFLLFSFFPLKAEAGGCGPFGAGIFCQGSSVRSPLPGGFSPYPGLDTILLTGIIVKTPPLPRFMGATYESAFRVLGIPQNTDLGLQGNGPALIVAAQPTESDMQRNMGNDPFSAIADDVIRGFLAKGIKKNEIFYLSPYLTTSPHISREIYEKDDDLTYFKSAMSLVQHHPSYFRRIAILAHSSITKDKGVYAEPVVGKVGIRFSAEQIRKHRIMLFGCAAKQGGITSGEVAALARRFAASGNFAMALANTGIRWEKTYWGLAGIPNPSVPALPRPQF